MKILKIELEQASANYRREETVDNAMTYPLPPISTVIGAIHAACGWQGYHDIAVAIQGSYGGISRNVKRQMVFYNCVMPDRGYFIKMPNETSLSAAYTLIAEPLGGESATGGRDVRSGKGYLVKRPDLLREFLELKGKDTKLMQQRKELRERKKGIAKNEKEVRKEIDGKISQIEKEREELKRKISMFRTFEYIPRHVETLCDVRLVLHISSSYIDEILKNIGNLTAIGRSEDFINVRSAKIVECRPAEIGEAIRQGAYIRCADLKCFSRSDGEQLTGTAYYFGGKYEITEGKRMFETLRCLWATGAKVVKPAETILTDTSGDTFNLLKFEEKDEKKKKASAY